MRRAIAVATPEISSSYSVYSRTNTPSLAYSTSCLATMTSRPPSPLKQSIKKFLSPKKQQPVPALSLQGGAEHGNWTYAGSTSSVSSSDSNGNTGWNVIDTPHTPTFAANKENRNTSQGAFDNVVGHNPSKLNKRNTKSTGILNHASQPELDNEFEELMVQPQSPRTLLT
jgi:hypothetical protein